LTTAELERLFVPGNFPACEFYLFFPLFQYSCETRRGKVLKPPVTALPRCRVKKGLVFQKAVTVKPPCPARNYSAEPAFNGLPALFLPSQQKNGGS
jgi:hypothetical protein